MTTEFTDRLAIKIHDNDFLDENELFTIISQFAENSNIVVNKVVYKDEQIFIINFENAKEAEKIYKECDGTMIEGTEIILSFLIVPVAAVFDKIEATVKKSNVVTFKEKQKRLREAAVEDSSENYENK